MFTVERPEVNARSGPGTDYPIVGSLRQGETYEVTGRNQAGDWWQFTLKDQPAWVKAALVRAGDQTSSVPLVVPSPPPTAPPRPTRTACAVQPGPSFARLWDRDRMGCPTGPETGIITAYESFQRGWMLWRQDDNGHYAFLADGMFTTYFYPPADPPDFACAEAQSKGAPRRGFSRVWCENPAVRGRIGDATGPEVGNHRPLQRFEGGFMIYVQERGTIASIYGNGTWSEQR